MSSFPEMWQGQPLYAQTLEAPAQAQAPAGAPAAAAQSSPFSLMPMLVAFVAIMYFLMIRPQQKRDRERRDMLGKLSKGDRVVTTGGLCGEVVGLTDSHAVLRVDDNCKIEFVRSAIASVAPREAKETK